MGHNDVGMLKHRLLGGKRRDPGRTIPEKHAFLGRIKPAAMGDQQLSVQAAASLCNLPEHTQAPALQGAQAGEDEGSIFINLPLEGFTAWRRLPGTRKREAQRADCMEMRGLLRTRKIKSFKGLTDVGKR